MKFYGYKKCSTCRKAEKYLESRGIDYKFIDITEKPPSATALKKIAKQAGIESKKMFNTSGEVYKSMNLKTKLPDMSEKEMFDLLASNGRLIKRPLVTDGEKSSVGFKEDVFAETFG